MINKDIKDLMKKYDLKQLDVAKYIGINRFTLSRWLRCSLTIDRKVRIDNGISRLARDKKNKLNDLVK